MAAPSDTFGRSRPRILPDVLLAAGLTAFMLLGTYFASHGQPGRRAFDAGAVALLVLAGAALVARRRHPVATLVAVWFVTFAYLVLGYAMGPIWLALIVAYFTAVVRGHGIPAAAIAVAGFLVFPWLDRLLRDASGPSGVALAALGAWLLVILGVAEAIRIRRERAAEALRMREEEALRRSSEERLRIAQDLHDALGHHLSLINVQAGVALHVRDDLPEPVRGSLAAIKDASKEALTELRGVLAILRQDGDRAPRTPGSSLERLDDLVSQASAAGIEVRSEVDGTPRPVPFGVDVAAFRIVQEALTNVARHAGPDARATVKVGYGDEDLTVQVEDDGGRDGDGGPPGGRPSQAPPGGGSGIPGMRERAAALGGELEAGPSPAGGFRVVARLPLEDAR
ncbi:MAG TPA: histidine kinase [Actinomycetota bacterium]